MWKGEEERWMKHRARSWIDRNEEKKDGERRKRVESIERALRRQRKKRRWDYIPETWPSGWAPGEGVG